ncbi:MAG: hypothetical protein CVU05_00980 [Bacteroidetes bacterium HGW-Bacteroidetes-21]|jgi:hypothetical protein|nr:MAG: hypothetical protein CVU05_00980 [Bacteroidetes bacterium HGW-Bacteroidetes-21]
MFRNLKQKNMKTMYVTFAILLTALIANAQYDTTKLDFGKSKILILTDKTTGTTDTVVLNNTDPENGENEDNDDCDEKKFNSHWGGIGIGLNGYLNNANEFKPLTVDNYLDLNQGKSWSVSLNLIETNIPIFKKYVGLATGLGLEFDNYRLANNVILINDSAKLYSYTDTMTNYKKNKLAVTWLTVPLVLEFNVPTHDKSINLGVGLLGAVRIGSHTKLVSEYKDNDIKEKSRGDYHMNWFRYGLTGQIGYGSVGVYVNYSLSSLFKTNEGPELYPWSAGIHLAF